MNKENIKEPNRMCAIHHRGVSRILVASLMLFLVASTDIVAALDSQKVSNSFGEPFISLAERVLPIVVSLSPYVPPSPSIRLNGMPAENSPVDYAAGVIMDGDNGYIVTNSHVVRGVEKIQVTLYGGEKIIGRIIGIDEDTDLALIKIDTDKKLPSGTFGDSSKIRVGQLVVAVGNPHGLSHTLTMGIVSGLNRENLKLSKYENFIQTDASINPGNSGGPLVNMDGEIIGINTAIINYAQGIGFAIPSNVVGRILSELIEFGEVRRGWLGIEIEVAPKELAVENPNGGAGVLVSAVFKNSPAFHAGVSAGNILLKIDSVFVNSPNEVTRIIGSMIPGQTINLEIFSKGERKVIAATLENPKNQK